MTYINEIRSNIRRLLAMMEKEIARFFNNTQAFIQGNPDLRDPR